MQKPQTQITTKHKIGNVTKSREASGSATNSPDLLQEKIYSTPRSQPVYSRQGLSPERDLHPNLHTREKAIATATVLNYFSIFYLAGGINKHQALMWHWRSRSRAWS